MPGRTPAQTTLRHVARDEATVTSVALETYERIVDQNRELRAFTYIDEETVRAEAHRVGLGPRAGALRGLPVAVKDMIDTADQPTTYGSPIYDRHRPARDAAVVRRLRDAGALVMGKTETTEFALFKPPSTRNPHDPSRTPGGSSSGSAAAVAAGLVPIALGTQTAGSVIRPASYCGVVGFKPTHGLIETSGIKPLSPSFDTVGVFGRSVSDVRHVFQTLRDDKPQTVATTRESSIGICRTPRWNDLTPDARDAFDTVVATLESMAGMHIVEMGPMTYLTEVGEAHVALMEFEAARALRPEHNDHREALSEVLQSFLDRAARRTDAEASTAITTLQEGRGRLTVDARRVDLMLTPAATGEAPTADTTGDPWFTRVWTALRVPTINLPLLGGETGLPIGLQAVGRRFRDDALLAAAGDLERALSPDANELRDLRYMRPDS